MSVLMNETFMNSRKRPLIFYKQNFTFLTIVIFHLVSIIPKLRIINIHLLFDGFQHLTSKYHQQSLKVKNWKHKSVSKISNSY